ncbi:phosphatidylglycerophosphatase B [Enterobacteriaceae bacterium ESL0689]|nr:phosphatidylglycerophosphatase B [Enterobacteriaceae bacterium ESL0689]
MQSIVTRTTIATALLLIMPVILWLSGWRWQPDLQDNRIVIWYWITQSVTRPWGIITHVLLCCWFCWCLRLPLRAAIVMLVIISSVILLGQKVNASIKNVIQEPRPFILWLEDGRAASVTQFYHLKRKQRAKRVAEHLAQRASVPPFLGQHWQNETGFAFPSGHTTFAASWALLAAGVLLPRRRRWTTVVLLAWAIAVMASRLMLGMHWPQDLVSATFISWLFVMPASWMIQRLSGSLTPPGQTMPEPDNTP